MKRHLRMRIQHVTFQSGRQEVTSVAAKKIRRRRKTTLILSLFLSIIIIHLFLQITVWQLKPAQSFQFNTSRLHYLNIFEQTTQLIKLEIDNFSNSPQNQLNQLCHLGLFFPSYAFAQTEKKIKQPIFGRNKNVFTVIWAIIWRIPLHGKFGRFFEFLPLLLSGLWIIIWRFLAYTTGRSLHLYGEPESSSFFVVFAQFMQLFYFFCFIMAVF
ncbi:MAG: hypothetical protein ACT6FF_09085 [Methanosarcinaceae archaeon]